MKRKPFGWGCCLGAFATTLLLFGWVPFYAACQKPERDPWQPPPVKVGADGLKLTPLDGRPDIRALYVQLRLRQDTIADDIAVVNSLRDADWFNAAMIVAPSWLERPDAPNNPIVRRAMATCRAEGLAVYWGRWLWVGWPSHVNERLLPGPASHFDAAYYAAAIATINAEGRMLGADATFFDAEPYGDSVQKGAIKRAKLTPAQQLLIADAIEDAVRYAGPVGLIYPTSSMRSSHYAWPITGLGQLRCDHKSFYTREPGRLVVRPPTGHDHRLHLWGAFATPNSRQIGGPESKSWTLTPAEVKALDVDAIRAFYPECVGMWVYSDDLIATLAAWGS